MAILPFRGLSTTLIVEKIDFFCYQIMRRRL